MMRRAMSKGALAALACFALLDARAVRLDPEGGGQALIYPYYTVRSYGTNPLNTYLSIVNTSADGKALRVRFREGRQGLETFGFNLFLSPNDAWTAALVPASDGGTLLVTSDRSCATFALSADANGVNREAFSSSPFAADGPDRTREGYVEVFEMGTVNGATLAAITQDASGVPRDCGAVQVRPVDTADIGAPSGGLQGTLTLINVASGMDMTLTAEPLADLAHKPYYRPPLDPYPDWNAAEIDPVSSVTTSSHAYRLAWSNALQAVDSVLMRTEVHNEFILEPSTASSTDWVITLPTRRLHVSGGTVTAPFSPASSTLQAGCEVIAAPVFDRSAQEFLNGPCSYNFDECPQPQTPAALCAAATVLPWSLSERPNVPLFGSKVPIQPSYVLFFSNAVAPSTRLPYVMYIGGAIRVAFRSDGPQAGLVSLGTSSRMDLRTGAVETGAFRIQGLPATGFMARSFVNGTLSCQGKACQGNYASAFMHQGMRSISVVP